MQLLVTVTFSPAVHFMHALVHHWPVAPQSNWHHINTHHVKLLLMLCDGWCWNDCIIPLDYSRTWIRDTLDFVWFVESF